MSSANELLVAGGPRPTDCLRLIRPLLDGNPLQLETEKAGSFGWPTARKFWNLFSEISG